MTLAPSKCTMSDANRGVLLPLGEEDSIEQNKNIGQEEKPAMVASSVAISGCSAPRKCRSKFIEFGTWR
jgi:hypothetical protein